MGKRNILIVGEAPGADEDAQGMQFVGKTGTKLREVLESVGINMRQDCIITNALICRPPNNEIPNPKMVDWCRPNLINTIQKEKPDVIIPLGTNAVASLLGWTYKDKVGSITKWAGYQIPDQKINAWICPTFHPSYITRMDDAVLNRMFRNHLQGAKDVSGYGKPWSGKVDFSKKVEPIKSPSEAARRIRSFPKKGRMAFDFETNMLKPEHHKSRIVCCSICFNGKKTIAFPWHGEAITETLKLLKNHRIAKYGYNIKFEQSWLIWHHKTRVANWRYDGNIGSHILDNGHENRPITSLKFQSYVLFGMPAYDEHIRPFLESKGKGSYAENRIQEVDLTELLIYCGIDSLLEYKVARKHEARFQS